MAQGVNRLAALSGRRSNRLDDAGRQADDQEAFERWAALLRERQGAPAARQAALGPREHGAYAELRVRDRPILGPIEQLLAIPGYTAAKGLGLMRGRSGASVDEMAEGYRGVGRGVLQNLRDLSTLR